MKINRSNICGSQIIQFVTNVRPPIAIITFTICHVIYKSFPYICMFFSEKFLWILFLLLIISPEGYQLRIIDFNTDNNFFHPFVQKIGNARNKNYLIKLLKRNLEKKLRKIRKLYVSEPLNNYEDPSSLDQKRNFKFKSGWTCTCGCLKGRNSQGKRCGHCDSDSAPPPPPLPPPPPPPPPPPQSEPESFMCESQGVFPAADDCQNYYICFRKDSEPLQVTCPEQKAFDPCTKKCSRMAAKRCLKRKHPRFIDNINFEKK